MISKELQAIFSRNIKAERTRRGLSQLKFAEKADLSVGYVCDLESGRRWGTPETFVKLAEALEIEPFQLLLDYAEVQSAEIRRNQAAFANLESMLRENITKAVNKTIKETLTVFLSEPAE